MTTINRTMPSPLPSAQPSAPRSKLDTLYKTLEELRGQLRSLHKRLADAGNVAERMAIRHQISAVEEMVEAIKQQIMVITQLEKRKHGAKPEVPGLDLASAAVAGNTESEDAAAATYKPPYDLGS